MKALRRLGPLCADVRESEREPPAASGQLLAKRGRASFAEVHPRLAACVKFDLLVQFNSSALPGDVDDGPLVSLTAREPHGLDVVAAGHDDALANLEDHPTSLGAAVVAARD